MAASDFDLIKRRDIMFSDLQPETQQSYSAAVLLNEVEGIIETEPASPCLLRVSYHLLRVSLEQIEEALTETGFVLSNRPMERIKRALYYYSEDTQRANQGCIRGECKCTRKIYINRHDRLDHGCRDPRPEHWRKYL